MLWRYAGPTLGERQARHLNVACGICVAWRVCERLFSRIVNGLKRFVSRITDLMCAPLVETSTWVSFIPTSFALREREMNRLFEPGSR